jgi:hypothetical protein
MTKEKRHKKGQSGGRQQSDLPFGGEFSTSQIALPALLEIAAGNPKGPANVNADGNCYRVPRPDPYVEQPPRRASARRRRAEALAGRDLPEDRNGAEKNRSRGQRLAKSSERRPR